MSDFPKDREINIEHAAADENWTPLDETPFNELLAKDEGRYTETKIPIDDPDLVVKEARTKWKSAMAPGMYPLNNIEHTKKDLNDLQVNFHEFIPKTQLVLAKNKRGQQVAYTIQERIEGKPINEIPIDETVRTQLSIFLKKLVDVFIENLHYENDETEPRSFYPDIFSPDNIIYGINKKRPGEPKHLYFVDTYPTLKRTWEHFLRMDLPRVIKWASPETRVFFEELQNDAETRVRQYVSEHRDELPRIQVKKTNNFYS